MPAGGGSQATVTEPNASSSQDDCMALIKKALLVSLQWIGDL